MNESPPSASEWLMVNGWGNFVQNKIVTQLQAVHSIAYNSLILPTTGQYSQVELSTAQYNLLHPIAAQYSPEHPSTAHHPCQHCQICYVKVAEDS